MTFACNYRVGCEIAIENINLIDKMTLVFLYTISFIDFEDNSYIFLTFERKRLTKRGYIL